MLPQPDEKGPYVGPRAFKREEQNLFFGRDREAKEIIALMVAHPVVLLYAQSGAGKTSLLNARLIPWLERDGFEIFPTVRIGGEIPQGVNPRTIHNLYVYNALLDWATQGDDPQRLASLSLADYLQTRPHLTDDLDELRPRALIFDQFEELFVLYAERWTEREPFFQQIAEALARDPLLRVLFVIREDYMAQLDPYARWLPEGLRARFRLERLREAAALEAIKKPLEGSTRHFAPGVAESLVRELLQIRIMGPAGQVVEVPGEFVEPVQLQVVCQRIWENLPPGVTEISAEHLQRFGDVDQALASFYEDAIRSVAQKTKVKESRLRSWCEQTLITALGTRGTVLREQALTGGIPNAAVDELEHKHLIRPEERAGARWYELTHDRFVRPIRDSNRVWREAKRAREMKLILLALGIVLAISVPFILMLLGRAAVEVYQAQLKVETMVVAVKAEGATLVVQQVATQQAYQMATATYDARRAELTRMAEIATATTQARRQEATRTSEAKQVEATRVAIIALGTAQVRLQQATATQVALALLPIETLRAMIIDPSPPQRIAGAKALGQAAAARPESVVEVVPALLGLLEGGQDPLVGTAAAEALGEIGPYIRDPALAAQVIETLRRVASSSEDAALRRAAQAALRSVEVPISAFVGSWANVDANTTGITRIEIAQSRDRLDFRVFGKCHPSDCDWGNVAVPYVRMPIIVPYVFNYARHTLTLTLDLPSNRLYVVDSTQYTDQSRRKDSTSRYVLAKEETRPTLLTPTPRPSPKLSVAPGEKLFVVLFWESDGLAIVDSKSSRVEKTVAFGQINARYVSANPARQEVYISFANGDTFFVVDARSGVIRGRIKEEVGWNAYNSVVSKDGGIVYLATSGGAAKSAENKILMIDPATLQVKKVIRLSSYSYPQGLGRIVMSPDGKWLYAIDPASGSLIILATATGEIETRVRAPGSAILGIAPDGNALYVLRDKRVSKVQIGTWREVWSVNIQSVEKVTVGGDIVYIPDSDAGQVLRVNDRTGRVLSMWKVESPVAVALSQDGSQAYVSSYSSNRIEVFDTYSSQSVAQIGISRGKGAADVVMMTVQ